MHEQIKEMTPEIMQGIYTNEKLRNAVAFAHACHSSFATGNQFRYRKALGWPISYKVTDEQIQEAKTEKERAKKELLTRLGNKLVFVGMGMEYDTRYEGDPCNHRIRTEIINSQETCYFIEVGRGRGDEMRVDHSINRTLQDRMKDGTEHQSIFHNWRGLERTCNPPKYTKQNIINLVNNAFECKFTEMVVDYYNLTTEDYKSISPK